MILGDHPLGAAPVGGWSGPFLEEPFYAPQIHGADPARARKKRTVKEDMAEVIKELSPTTEIAKVAEKAVYDPSVLKAPDLKLSIDIEEIRTIVKVAVDTLQKRQRKRRQEMELLFF